MPLILLLLSLTLFGCATGVSGDEPSSDPPPDGCGRAGALCGGQAPSGCWCDDACLTEGDCCLDAATTCPQPAMIRTAPFVGTQALPVFLDLAPDEAVDAPLEVVVSPPTLARVGTGGAGGRTYLDGGWRRSLTPLAWLTALAPGNATVRVRTRGHPHRVLAETEVEMHPDAGVLERRACRGLGEVVVTREAGQPPVALTGRLEASLREGWLEVSHPATGWRLGLGPGVKVLPRGQIHRTASTTGAGRRSPKLLLPRGCRRGRLRLEELELSDEVDGVAMSWSLQCGDGAMSDGCLRMGTSAR